MNSIERVRLALNHQEPDRVPLDIAGTGVSQIHATAYRNLRQYLGLSAPEPDPLYRHQGRGFYRLVGNLSTGIPAVVNRIIIDLHEFS